MAAQNTKPASNSITHHRVRTVFASLFGFAAVGLILTSILVVWLDSTLTNTSQYVQTVAPLVSKPAVQNFIVDKTATGLLDNDDAPIQDIAGKILGEDKTAGKTDAQLRTEITPIMKESLRSVVTSPSFAALWKSSNQSIHSQLIAQLNSNSQTINLDFHPLITGVIDQLGTTKLGFVKDKLQLKSDAGQVSLHGKQLKNVRKVYNYFQTAMFVIVGLAVVCFGLSAWISVHHLKTIRRVALATGIYAALLAGLLSATSLFKFSGTDAEQQKMIVALVNGVTRDLRLSLLAVVVVCIIGVIGSKVYAVKLTKKSSSPLAHAKM